MHTRLERLSFTLAVSSLCAAAAAPALAISTSHWTQTSEPDFRAGTLHNVVATNLGDLKLARAVKTILEQDAKVTSVNCLAQAPDGTIYAGTGPSGILLAVKGDKVTTAATIENAINILSVLAQPDGAVLVGTGGEAGKVFRIDKPGDKPREIFAADGVQYVWKLAATPDGNLYAATGPNGELYEIKPDGSHAVLYKGNQNNLTALLSDGGDRLYVGTDPDGLVVRVDRKTRESFVLYNAAESEITALATDAAGNLYAATGEVDERQQPPAPAPGGADAAGEKTGRPENDTGGTPIPSAPPTAPKPPEVPNPNPGEPAPIPKRAGAAAGPARVSPVATLGVTHVAAFERMAQPAVSSRTSYPLSRRPALRPLLLDAVATADAPQTMQDAGGNGGDDSPEPGTKPNAPAAGANGPAAPHNAAAPAANNAAADADKPEGNAVYKIDPDGFVTEIFRQNVVIYSMIEQNGALLVGTGPSGNIFQIDPQAEETIELAKVDPKQVTALLAAADGRTIMGLANTGGLSAMTAGFAADGYYTSPVLDATQISRFGKIHLHGSLPAGTGLKISTRSGNVKDAGAAGWSKWSAEAPASEYSPATAPPARFLQYRLSFSADDHGSRTPVVDDVDTSYQMPNLAPVVKSVRIGAEPASANAGGKAAAANALVAAPGGDPKPAGTGVQPVAWEASDPNDDALVYALYFRAAGSGPWILLKDKLKEPTFEWDTRTVADGRYQVKVVASDAAANPAGQGKTTSRVSDPVVVDNTPPTIGDVSAKADGTTVKVSLRVVDATSTVAECAYAVDSNDDWQAVLPSDNIFDDPEESVSFSVPHLAPGSHQITLRATDAHGNAAFHTLVVKIDGEPTTRESRP